jgi:long-chain acyl-CoA synthetase
MARELLKSARGFLELSFARSMSDTLPKVLLQNAEIFAKRPAIRLKDLGIWQTWTWEQALEEVRAFALGLGALGVRRGDTMAIVGDNRPRLYWSMMAAQSLGAIPVPMYQDAVAQELAYVLAHSEAKLAVAQNQEQVDKLLSIAAEAPLLRNIIYDEQRGLRDYEPGRVRSLESVAADGRAAFEGNPKAGGAWLKNVSQGSRSDPAVILYTSGTTGQPKGVVLSHENVLVTARNANAFDKLSEKDEIIAYLPMAWVGDHIFSYGQALAAGFCVSCPESPQTVLEDRREIGPTYFFAPPRVYENLLTAIMVRMEDAGWTKRALFKGFMAVAKRAGERVLNSESVSPVLRALYGLGNLLVYGPLKNRLGLTRARVAYTAGEAIGPEIFRFYRSIGLNLKQFYGQTEASVYVTLQADGEAGADHAGKPAPGVEIRISPSGEVEYRGPGVFQRYFKNDEATHDAKTADGWVKTGDAGIVEPDGTLKIVDRAKDVGRLNNGAMLPPKYIENKLKFYPNIKEAVVFGDGRDFAAAFINIDLLAVGNWAERNNVTYASYQELAADRRVYEMIRAHADEVNRSLAKEPALADAQIRRFLILHKELDADDGELTRTQKVRRGFIAERYAPLVTALYDGSAEQHIATAVTFEDGRKGVIEAAVRIEDLPAYAADGRPLPSAGMRAPHLEAAE